MRLADVRAIYGPTLKLETKSGIDDVHSAVVRNGGNELVFISSLNLGRPMRDSDVITMMLGREYSNWLGGDC